MIGILAGCSTHDHAAPEPSGHTTFERSEDLFPPLANPAPMAGPPPHTQVCPGLITPRYYAMDRTDFAERLKVAIPTWPTPVSVRPSCDLAEQVMYQDPADGTTNNVWERGMAIGKPVACRQTGDYDGFVLRCATMFDEQRIGDVVAYFYY
ncbi:hypothetical protein MYK68_05600 [Gordonia sp. PP30]|uniref:hypothetical protein n=1 Tax=Gordonia sp. PP30 TaxID=2935861 RepID=UPI001FFFEE2F|nr:hypothetical protein [Gordonia sp. PP30]UQE76067.1 hypothetical protein MYK68_05600 [Gordonia sp. PP30]